MDKGKGTRNIDTILYTLQLTLFSPYVLPSSPPVIICQQMSPFEGPQIASEPPTFAHCIFNKLFKVGRLLDQLDVMSNHNNLVLWNPPGRLFSTRTRPNMIN